ncbi:MAG: regulatory protein RecX [Butyrivibrio sp.]|uniref:regulatory protein RecX n=1 Tax=Butyrivibrio sp. TaxID=28121 RepID=UPI001B01A9F6|nr:regulatory protein RecX [Butyrivibrio sp.]MBO6239395.1 regulatory protein RecX [Butyrivibrio sp.]
MIISDIIEFDKKRSKVYIDGEFAFLLYKGELRDYSIKINNELSENSYETITKELLPKRATKRAMNLLQKKDYTEKQLRDKLSEGLYSDEAMDAAIDYVKSYRYLDDRRFARDYVVYHIEARSKNRVVNDLVSKGISKQTIIDTFEELENEGLFGDISENQLNQITDLLNKKHYRSDMEYKDKQKIMAFLLRKGYDMDLIKKAMENT